MKQVTDLSTQTQESRIFGPCLKENGREDSFSLPSNVTSILECICTQLCNRYRQESLHSNIHLLFSLNNTIIHNLEKISR